MPAKPLMQGAALPAQSEPWSVGLSVSASERPSKRNWRDAMDEVRALPHSHNDWPDDERPPAQRTADIALAILTRLRQLIAPPPEVGASGDGDITLDWWLGDDDGTGYFSINVDEGIIVYRGHTPNGVFFSGKCASNADSAAQVEQFARKHAPDALAELMREQTRSPYQSPAR